MHKKIIMPALCALRRLSLWMKLKISHRNSLVQELAASSHLVQSVVVDSDIIKLSALLYVFEVSLRSGEGKLVFVHVGDVPQDVFTAPLGYDLRGERERET